MASKLTSGVYAKSLPHTTSLFGWLVADGWCWFVLREEYCWLVAGGWFVVREKYCWLVADKPSEQGERSSGCTMILAQVRCHATRSLIDKMDNSQHAQPHRYELTHTLDTHVHPVYPVLYSFPKHIPFLFLKHSHIFKALTHF
jgi:hypothetical protein